jgi:hypothetical protein
VIIVLDEARDLGFEIAGQVIVLEQNAVLERLVQRSILPSASMKRSIAIHSTATDGSSTSKCQAK